MLETPTSGDLRKYIVVETRGEMLQITLATIIDGRPIDVITTVKASQICFLTLLAERLPDRPSSYKTCRGR